MAAVAPVTRTSDPYTNSVLGDYKWASENLTYSFPATGALYEIPYGSNEPLQNFGALNGTQQSAARAAFANYAAVANVTFTELTGSSTPNATIRVAMSDAPSTAWAYLPSTAPESGDVWFNKSSGYYNNPVSGNYAFTTFMHELGHSLGLEHPHENGMPLDRDSMEYTVMSYRSYVGASTTTGYTNETWGFAQTLMMYDIAAVQSMYGANFSTSNGNTTYSWSPTTGEMSINGAGQGAAGGNRIFQTLWDGGGTDTFDFSNYTTNLSVDLRPGGWTTTSSAQLARLHYNGSQIADGNIANALQYNGDARSLIENAIGGSGNDTIMGNAADNVLRGGLGNDGIQGAAGNDQLFGEEGNDLLVGGSHIRMLGVVGISTQSGAMGAEWKIVGAADTDGDGISDIVWSSGGQLSVWGMLNGDLKSFGVLAGRMGAEWKVTSLTDFSGDGRSDALWVSGGRLAVWELNGTALQKFTTLSGAMGAEWTVRGTGLLNADSATDVVWANNNGQVCVWEMQGTALARADVSAGKMGAEWSVVAVVDLLGSGRDGILWQSATGHIQYWGMDGGRLLSLYNIGQMGSEWTLAGSGDFNNDTTNDLVWVDQANRVQIWEMASAGIVRFADGSDGAGAGTTLSAIGNFLADGVDDLLWYDNGGTQLSNLGQGFGDVLAGGPGADVFRFEAVSEAGKIISDFGPGVDVLDVDQMLDQGGYAGSQAINDGIVRLLQQGTDTLVQMNLTGGAEAWDTIAKLTGVDATSLSSVDFLF